MVRVVGDRARNHFNNRYRIATGASEENHVRY
jgi:hypothetical protein